MRPKVLEIAWHETQAVYSCDFQPLPPAQLKRLLPTANEDEDKDGKDKEKDKVVAGGRSYRLATAGGDSKVRLWMIHPNIPLPNLSAHVAATGQEIAPHPPRSEYLATLSKHTAAVNVVRFSPNGQTLASAGDDGNVILWVQSDRAIATFGESSEEPDKEHWRLQKMLQVTTKHVYDLAWSPDGDFFIAGSTDNTATIWKASTGECVFALREHSHNVQGVSWDPLNEYIATQSSDRSVHVNTFLFRNGMPDVHPVSRANRMELRQSRTPSAPSGVRPNMARRGSNTSDAGSVITTTSEFPEHYTVGPPSAPSAAPMTPSASVPSTPQPNAIMNPPPSTTKAGSRRSSFSGSQAAGSPNLNASAFAGRGRSPSPMPQLPAIRAPAPTHPAILQRLYGDESVTRFFRRLSFSPDGSLLMTPAGQIEDQLYKGSPMLGPRSLSQDGAASGSEPPSAFNRPKNVDAGRPTVFIYSRANLARAPIAHLPGHKTPAVAIRFSPIFYDLRTQPSTAEAKHVMLDKADKGPIHVSLSMPPPPPPIKDKDKKEDEKDRDREKERERSAGMGSIFALPYRLIYAVACQDSVLLYDTQQSGPIAVFRGLHYAGFTDIAWSPDGQALMLASSDGYCSIVVFDLAELGTVHPTQQHHRQLAAIAQNHATTHYSPAAPAHHHASSFSSQQRESFSSAHRDSIGGTPVPQSPAVSTLRQSPAPTRSEREGSASSSVIGLGPPQSLSLPLFAAPSSASSVTDHIPRTPVDEVEGYTWRMGSGSGRGGRSGSESSASASQAGGFGLGLGQDIHLHAGAPGSEAVKRTMSSGETETEAVSSPAAEPASEQPKKKRRVALTHLGSEGT